MLCECSCDNFCWNSRAASLSSEMLRLGNTHSGLSGWVALLCTMQGIELCLITACSWAPAPSPSDRLHSLMRGSHTCGLLAMKISSMFSVYLLWLMARYKHQILWLCQGSCGRFSGLGVMYCIGPHHQLSICLASKPLGTNVGLRAELIYLVYRQTYRCAQRASCKGPLWPAPALILARQSWLAPIRAIT